MQQRKSISRQRYKKDSRWHAINRLIAPLMPARELSADLLKRHGINISIRGIYNWRYRGVSYECVPAVADLLGVSVEEVLRASGKL